MFGGFIAAYNYLTYRLEDPPFSLPTAVVSMLFLAYLFGTVTSRLTGRWALRWGRRRVLTAGAIGYAAGMALTLVDNLAFVLAGLVLFTASYWTVQAIAAGWAGAKPKVGTAQAVALYNVGYYAGAAVIGWAFGFPYRWWGWPAVVAGVLALIAVAQALAHTAPGLKE
jgi:MFS family permease